MTRDLSARKNRVVMFMILTRTLTPYLCIEKRTPPAGKKSGDGDHLQPLLQSHLR